MKRGFTILAIVTALLLSFALYEALIGAPTERTMGDVQRIFYYHVPSAWTAFLMFLINFVASVLYLLDREELPAKKIGFLFGLSGLVLVPMHSLVRKYLSHRHQTMDIVALVSAEIGVVFCTVVLVTGPIWARPVWGIWWTWDLRLTLTLVLWLIYVSYLVLRRFSTSSQTATLAAVLAIFGALDVPLVYFSIWFFRTQHPSPVIGDGGSLDPRMARVLLINWAAFLCLAWLMAWTRYRLEVLKREVDEAQAIESLMEPSR